MKVINIIVISLRYNNRKRYHLVSAYARAWERKNVCGYKTILWKCMDRASESGQSKNFCFVFSVVLLSFSAKNEMKREEKRKEEKSRKKWEESWRMRWKMNKMNFKDIQMNTIDVLLWDWPARPGPTVCNNRTSIYTILRVVRVSLFSLPTRDTIEGGNEISERRAWKILTKWTNR